MRTAALAMVPFLWLLAGCAQPVVDAPADPSDGAGQSRMGRGEEAQTVEGNATLRRLQAEYGLRLTSANAVLALPNLQGASCVQIGRAPLRIVSGTATLEWSPQSVLAESLHLDVLQHSSGTYHAAETGRSPLTISLEDVVVEATGPSGELLDFRAGPDDLVDATFAQDATLTLDFEYVAERNLSGSIRSSC